MEVPLKIALERPVHCIKHLLEVSDPLQFLAGSALSRDSEDSGPSGKMNREMPGKHDHY